MADGAPDYGDAGRRNPDLAAEVDRLDEAEAALREAKQAGWPQRTNSATDAALRRVRKAIDGENHDQDSDA